MLLLATLVQTFLKGLHKYTNVLYSEFLRIITNTIVIPLSFYLSTLGYFAGTLAIGFVTLGATIAYTVRAASIIDIRFCIKLPSFSSTMKELLSYGQKASQKQMVFIIKTLF